jgi:thioredoxin-related protein
MKQLNNNILITILLVLLLGLFGAYLYKTKQNESKEREYNGENQWRDWGIAAPTNPNPNPIVEPKTDSQNPGSYKEALDISKKTGKPLFICFKSDSCIWCLKMEKETFDDAKVKKTLEKYVVYTANQSKEPKLAEAFKVSSFPSYFVINSGKIVKRGQGYRPPAAFLVWLQPINVLPSLGRERIVPSMRRL